MIIKLRKFMQQKGQATVELGLLVPLILALAGVTLQGGILFSDQINLEQYAIDGAQWADLNNISVSDANITSYVLGRMCGGDGNTYPTPISVSAASTKYCQSGNLSVTATPVTTPTSMLPQQTSPIIGPTSQVLAAKCLPWDISISPSSISNVQGNLVSYTITLSIGAGRNGDKTPSVSLSGSGYPAGTSPGFPQFNPAILNSNGGTSVLTFSTTNTSVPGTYTVLVGGTDTVCGSGPTTGNKSVTLVVTSNGSVISPPPCVLPTISQVTPSLVTTGTTINIIGTHFTSEATVTMAGIESPLVTYVSSNQITAQVSLLSQGVHNLTVTVSEGCSVTSSNSIKWCPGGGCLGGTPSPSPSTVSAQNQCAPQATPSQYQTLITITWHESLLVPWVISSFQLQAQQYTYCQ
jgi:hypothetical protein